MPKINHISWGTAGLYKAIVAEIKSVVNILRFLILRYKIDVQEIGNTLSVLTKL